MSLVKRLVRKYHRKYSRWSLKQMGIFKTIQEIPHETDPGDLRAIYLMIKKLKPEKVVEYGAGVSTYIILLAMAENDRGSLYSVEQHEEYGKRVFGAIPKTLKTRLCESIVWPPSEADLIYVDDENKDIIPTISRAQPGTKILIDNRVEQTEKIVEFLRTQRAFQFKKTWIYENPLITLGPGKA